MSRINLESATRGLPESADVRTLAVMESTASPDGTVASLTSNFGLTDILLDTLTGPSSVSAPDGDIVILEPPSTNTQPLRLAASSTELGIPLSSRGFSVFRTTSTVLYLGTTGSEPVPNVKIAVL